VTEPALWFVVPAGFDERERVSGGNVYDLRVIAELRSLGEDVRIAEARTGANPFEGIPDGALAVVDGLVAVRESAQFSAAAERLRLVALVHMLVTAFADPENDMVDGERRVLPRALHVVATSAWLRDEIVTRRLVAPERITVATPGSDAAPLTRGSAEGSSLLCVGVVASHKGQDTLIEALGSLEPDRPWTCTFVGSTAIEPGFAARVSAKAADTGLTHRITWAGVLETEELHDTYARTDVLVAPSRTESYGIAVGEALRRGIPVIASDVGGIREVAQPEDAVVLVRPEDPAALGDALRRWLDGSGMRRAMRDAARRAAPDRRSWSDTARDIRDVLTELP
jgi:glycosyltransferase involved in cell wall biosynthesis